MVADQQHAAILSALTAIEAEHGFRILYACESGSRGWGFASPDSDYDVRFLYVPPLPWYLRVRPRHILPATTEQTSGASENEMLACRFMIRLRGAGD